MWVNAPFSQLAFFLQHCLHCKQLSPDDTSACILVPGYLLAMCKPLLSGMHLLKKFSKGAAIFEQFLCKGHASTALSDSWPVYIYTDVPDEGSKAFRSGQPVHKLHIATVASVAQGVDTPVDKSLAMLFERCFWGEHGRGLSAPVLLDSGASSNFVSPSFLQQLGISHSPSSAKLKLADSSEAPILGKVRLRFKLQHFTATATCFVTDLCDEFSVILGNSFMLSHSAV